MLCKADAINTSKNGQYLNRISDMAKAVTEHVQMCVAKAIQFTWVCRCCHG